jgi:hypothetical protein
MSLSKTSLPKKEVYVFFHPKKECSFVLEDGSNRISLIFKDIRVARKLVDLHPHLLPSPGYFSSTHDYLQKEKPVGNMPTTLTSPMRSLGVVIQTDR